MSTNILLISQGVSFMGNSIQKNLESAGYSVERIDPELRDIREHKDDTDIFVFYLGKYVSEISDTLVYLKDICIEEEKFLFILGTIDEIDIVSHYIPSAAISAKFERPFDMKKVLAELGRYSQAVEARDMKKSILLVDDDPTFLKMMKGWLEEEYRITVVTSGTQALMYIADNKPDLILLDYEMPVTSGPQVLEMIRSETKVDRIPVIFLTGKGDRESVLKVLSLKPDGYLLKSLNRDQILKSIYEFFEKKHAEEAKERAFT